MYGQAGSQLSSVRTNTGRDVVTPSDEPCKIGFRRQAAIGSGDVNDDVLSH